MKGLAMKLKTINGEKTLPGLTVFFVACLVVPALGAKQPPPIKDCIRQPLKYVGTEQTDKQFYHGALRQAVGVHCYQAFRANRTRPCDPGKVGWTYNHQPYLVYWRNRFYLEFLSDLRGEHVPPGRTVLATSKDGRVWSNPQIAFPPYVLPAIKRHFDELGDVDIPEGTYSVMHQRMGFYIAPNGRLLVSAFYSFCPTPRRGPNNGQGLGRVIREVYPDNTLGPIYFIRYNRHAGWNETNTKYPFYKESPDKGFVQACDALLKDKLFTLQWWEEDRARDGFFTIKPFEQDVEPKAFAWCHRPDGVVLGVWKHRLSALSPDDGKTWTRFGKAGRLRTCGAKTWVQKTEDGRYALVYNHSATGYRFPMAVMTSDDCYHFDNLLCLNGQVPPIRYQGLHKNVGPQYIRGIVEGNGNPPGKHMWNTFSVNKEDIWVSRTHVPITDTVDQHVDQNFESVSDIAQLEMWNLYVPKWAPISIVEDPAGNGNHCLELRDEEPYDYARVERIFPASKKVEVSFRVFVQQVGQATLDVEVQGPRGQRPMRLRFDPDWLSLDRDRIDPHPVRITTGKWLNIRLRLDCDDRSYALWVNGREIHDHIRFAEKVDSLQRLVFRTGPWRGFVKLSMLKGEPATKGLNEEDAAGADDKAPISLFLVDDVKTADGF